MGRFHPFSQGKGNIPIYAQEHIEGIALFNKAALQKNGTIWLYQTKRLALSEPKEKPEDYQ